MGVNLQDRCWVVRILNALVWMVPTRLFILKSSSPFINLLVTVPNAPIIIGINVTFIFHSFFQFPSKVEVFVLFFTLFLILICGQPEHQSPQFLFFCYHKFVVWLRLGDPFVSQNPRGIFVYHSPGLMLGCAYAICSYGQISISWTIPCGSLCPPSRIYTYTLSVLICYPRLLCDSFISTTT